MDNKTFFKVEKIHGKMYDCDCCGSYCSEGTNVYVNDTLVWEKYSDGHLYGRQTEENLLNCIVKEWNRINLEVIENNHTEESRLKWNKSYPGNGIARTPESWEEYKNEMLQYQDGLIENVMESCKNLPYDETLQTKMIALWIESVSGEKIEVLEEDARDPCDQEYSKMSWEY